MGLALGHVDGGHRQCRGIPDAPDVVAGAPIVVKLGGGSSGRAEIAQACAAVAEFSALTGDPDADQRVRL